MSLSISEIIRNLIKDNKTWSTKEVENFILTNYQDKDFSRSNLYRLINKIKAKLGRHQNLSQEKKLQLDLNQQKLETQETNRITIDQKKDEVYLEASRITSLDELIKQCNIDLSIWEIDRHVINKWEVGAKNAEGVIETSPLFQVKCWLKKKKKEVLDLEKLKLELISELKDGEYNKSFQFKNNYKKQEDANMLLISIFDLHCGKLAWKEESDNYDYKIARTRFKNALSDIINKVSGYKIDKIVFPVGNDLFNSDTAFPYPSTTGGTPQSDDIRWQQLWREVRKLIIEGINSLAEIAPVYIPIVSGNHDFSRTFFLGDLLEIVYENNLNITVDNSPKTRKYFQYHKNLLAFTHGNEEKMSDLPLIMAQEEPQLWADTRYRDWYLGHLHTAKTTSYKSTEEFKGVNIKHMRSLSGVDSWHQKKGYIGNIGGCDAFIYSKEEGIVSQIMHNLKYN